MCKDTAVSWIIYAFLAPVTDNVGENSMALNEIHFVILFLKFTVLTWILFFVNVKTNLNQIKLTYTAHTYSLGRLIDLWIIVAFRIHYVLFLSFCKDGLQTFDYISQSFQSPFTTYSGQESPA